MWPIRSGSPLLPMVEIPSSDEKLRASAWEYMTRTADQYNDPGQFTALIGYEWSALPGGNNMHRNVIFRDDKEKASRMLPYL